MRIIFFGTPELCIPYLEMLSNQHDLLAVVCNPDQPVGRKQVVTPPPTKVWALEHGVPVLQPDRLRGFVDELVSYQADIYIVVAYGKIIPSAIINQPKYGTLNVHYSLLPRWRGASPVEAAVLAGDEVSGVCVQQMRFELDSGPIWVQEEVYLGPNAFAREVRDGVMGDIGVRLLADTLIILASESVAPQPVEQVGIPTFCYRIQKGDGELLPADDDLSKWRKYRAYHPWPGVFYFDEHGARVKINTATYENNQFIPTMITRDGEKPTSLV